MEANRGTGTLSEASIKETAGMSAGSYLSTSLPMKALNKQGGQGAPGAGLMLIFVYAICFMEGAGTQLLPASFRALEVNLALTPSSLALLLLGQALAQWICTPIWGALADSGRSRKWLLLSAVSSWGVITLLSAVCSHYYSIMFLRILNGMALGSLSPISQSLIIDAIEPHQRGKYFGVTQLTSNAGMMICGIGTSTISNQLVFGSIQGWRFAFAAQGVASLVLALAMLVGMAEPQRRGSFIQPTLFSEFSKLQRYWRIPTFRVLVLQGMFGSIPWSALSFLTLFFQYIGMTDLRASLLFGTSMLASAIGGMLGGCVGDCLAQWSWKHGRPLTAQISVLCGIPGIIVTLNGIPHDPSYFHVFQASILVSGIMASWCGVGVNRPILSEIVQVRDRASVFAWMITIDGTFASLLGAPVVGLLAEHVFKYQPTTDPIDQMPLAQRELNADALSRALLWCCIGPWMICFIYYCFLHATYAQDVSRDGREEADTETLSFLPS